MDKNIIVTGATGWLGSRFVWYARNKYPEARIICLVHPDEVDNHVFSSDIEVVACDLTDEEKTWETMMRFDFESPNRLEVYHTAGVIHPKTTKAFEKINYKGTVCFAFGLSKYFSKVHSSGCNLVYISSNSACGFNDGVQSLNEKEYTPYMKYGRSKDKTEVFLQSISENKEARGSITTLRPCWFYGVGQPERQTHFFRMTKKGKVPIVGDGKNYRSMTYIDDLCKVMLEYGDRKDKGYVARWVVDEYPHSMNEIIDTIEDLLENEFDIPCAHKRVRLPKIVSSISRKVDWCLQAVGLYNQKIHVLGEYDQNIWAENEVPHSNTGLREGMRRSIQWCLDNGIEI